MGDGSILLLASILLVVVPVGLVLSQYWAKSRPPGVVRLDAAEADPKPELESALKPENTPQP